MSDKILLQKSTNNNTSLISTCHCNAVLGTQRDFSVLMTVEGHAGEARHYHTPLFSSLFTFYKGPAVSIIGIFTIDKVSASGFIWIERGAPNKRSGFAIAREKRLLSWWWWWCVDEEIRDEGFHPVFDYPEWSWIVCVFNFAAYWFSLV